MNDVTGPLGDVHTGNGSGLLMWIGLHNGLQDAPADFVGHHTAQSDAVSRIVDVKDISR